MAWVPHLCVIDVSQVVEGSAFPHPVPVLLADLQVAAAADHCLVKLAHNLQGVAEVAGGFGLPKAVAHRTGKGQVVFVILEKAK